MMFRQISLGTLGQWVGGVMVVVGLYAYFADNATLNLAGFFYGIPLLLGGLALKASELKPIPLKEPTTAEVLALREQQATSTQNQIRNDVTRYRYGQAAHLDSSLKALGLSPTDEERPRLVSLRETTIAGAYALILEFESPFFPLATWQQKQEKMASFFGPGIRVEASQTAENQIEVALIVQPAITA